MKKLLLLLVMTMVAMVSPVRLSAQTFKFYYRGVTFKCNVKHGQAVIKAFDPDAEKVVIPSQVKDKKGKTYQVSTIDLFSVLTHYASRTVVIEPGITKIARNSFYYFTEIESIYIPNTIEYIGEEAFNRKHMPTFNMSSSIDEATLRIGSVFNAHNSEKAVADVMADVDLSVYGNEEMLDENGNVVDNAVETPAPKAASITPGTSDVDYNIPVAGKNRDNTFCLIIANEKYKQRDTPNVKYAAQDGKTFESYCLRTLGLPRENIRIAQNASFLQMKSMLEWFKQVAEVYGGDSRFIVYYAGHGVPDERGNCKLIPSDVSINDVGNGFSLKDLYASLGSLTTNNVLVLIDACFSGNDREDVAALDEMHRGLAREIRQDAVTGNVVVITAASGNETALSYDEKAHGLFSYYLMKKLQETKGNVTYGELYDYVKKEVMRKSVVAKGKKQTPSASYSSRMSNNWKNIKF